MNKKRIFMYATHPTTVEQESYLFYKLGFDVYSAMWASGENAYHLKFSEEGKFSDIYKFNPKHFYQGKCTFLDDDAINKISNVDCNKWLEKPKYIESVRDALLDNFDILYTSTPTHWLLYAEDFLKAGKTVIHRVFFDDPYTWSRDGLDVLFTYNKFFVVSCMPTVNKCYKRSYHAEPIINKELVNEPSKEGDYALTIFPVITPWVYQNINNSLLNAKIKWVVHEYISDGANKARYWVSGSEMDKLFANCLLFADLNVVVRYPILEAIVRNKPVVMLGNSVLKDHFTQNGLLSENSRFFYTRCDYQDISEVIINMAEDKNLREQTVRNQSLWLEDMISKSINVWREVLEV